jgi:hypothetical protein
MKEVKGSICISVKARKALEELWVGSCLKGRTWGPKGRKKPSQYAGTNITLAFDDELVVINLTPDKKGLVIHEFKLTKDTSLAKKVRRILTMAKINVV